MDDTGSEWMTQGQNGGGHRVRMEEDTGSEWKGKQDHKGGVTRAIIDT